ncbi:MAG: PAS domain-containing protein [Rhizobium sp.]|nr:PAS domain-containing protein [Rhizobium sp.]
MAYSNASEAWPTSPRGVPSGDFLTGCGASGEEIRHFDWGATSLGPIEGWPISLKTTVSLVLSSKQPMCFWWGRELLKFYNDAYVPMLGQRAGKALGRPFQEVWADVWDDVVPFVRSALSGEATWMEDMPLTMQRNGYPEETYWTFSYSPLYGDDGAIEGLLNIVTETTQAVADRAALLVAYERAQEHIRERAAHESELKLLNQELVHRMKNTLAMTQSIVTQSLRGSDSITDAIATVTARIGALSKAQDILTGSLRSAAGFEEIVSAALVPHRDRDDRFIISGVPIYLTAQQALGLSLAIHELATNATKYGALSLPEGRIEIRWSVGENGAFSFEWVEIGGPPVTAPERRGFGSRLTERIISAIFSGEGRMGFEPTGLTFRLAGRLDTSPNVSS